MGRCILAVLAGLGAVIAAGAAQAQVPPELFGQYGGIVCGPAIKGCIPTTASDSVTIQPAANGRATVSVRIIFAGGQTCDVDGEGRWQGGKLTLVAEGLEANRPCRLGMRVASGVLSLDDPDRSCREVYCGTRGAFDGARFKKTR